MKSSNLARFKLQLAARFTASTFAQSARARKRNWFDYRRFRCTVANVKLADRQVRRSANPGKTACTERSREPFFVIPFASRPNYSCLSVLASAKISGEWVCEKGRRGEQDEGRKRKESLWGRTVRRLAGRKTGLIIDGGHGCQWWPIGEGLDLRADTSSVLRDCILPVLRFLPLRLWSPWYSPLENRAINHADPICLSVMHAPCGCVFWSFVVTIYDAFM